MIFGDVGLKVISIVEKNKKNKFVLGSYKIFFFVIVVILIVLFIKNVL